MAFLRIIQIFSITSGYGCDNSRGLPITVPNWNYVQQKMANYCKSYMWLTAVTIAIKQHIKFSLPTYVVVMIFKYTDSSIFNTLTFW